MAKKQTLLSKIEEHQKKHPDARFIAIYEGAFVTTLYGNNIVEAIKDFNKCYNASLTVTCDMVTQKVYQAIENDKPDVRGYYNHSHFDIMTKECVFNEDELTRPIVKIKPTKLTKTHTDGYIDRDGNFYKCGFEGHKALAKELELSKTIHEKTDSEKYLYDENLLDERGWVKISSSRINYLEYKESGSIAKLSDAQKTLVLEYFDMLDKLKIEFNHHKIDRERLVKELYD